MQGQYSANTYYLVRHGEAENNILGVLNATERGEYALTNTGREQIKELAAWITKEPVDFIVSSPLRRARETAEILRDTLEVPLSIDTRLCEPQFGAFEGKPMETFFEFMRTHGGRTIGDTELHIEGFMDIRERVRSFLETTNEVFAGKHMLIVSHADTLQELYAELLGEPVGAQQVDRGWYPHNGSSLIVSAGKSPISFSPTR